MHKKTFTVAALAALVVAVLSAFTVNLLLFPQVQQYFEIHINRNADSQIEEIVLAAAESINYSDATKLERFNGPN